jgi:hypothetical protein
MQEDKRVIVRCGGTATAEFHTMHFNHFRLHRIVWKKGFKNPHQQDTLAKATILRRDWVPAKILREKFEPRPHKIRKPDEIIRRDT